MNLLNNIKLMAFNPTEVTNELITTLKPLFLFFRIIGGIALVFAILFLILALLRAKTGEKKKALIISMFIALVAAAFFGALPEIIKFFIYFTSSQKINIQAANFLSNFKPIEHFNPNLLF
ncbi:hypothetical protein I7636_02220 [Mycoplasma mycoides subsp. capri]|uniref:hypothetical protein n=1 Tax=Mycoplasma mycoides TaxID=2102 RepID=UPI00223FD818|nr:hypothetical protein [Mycoplasma mycoides]QVK01554.1 hypothetical protein I7636_02220 [Mycoplasma mycoides subsp. capri]